MTSQRGDVYIPMYSLMRYPICAPGLLEAWCWNLLSTLQIDVPLVQVKEGEQSSLQSLCSAKHTDVWPEQSSFCRVAPQLKKMRPDGKTILIDSKFPWGQVCFFLCPFPGQVSAKADAWGVHEKKRKRQSSWRVHFVPIGSMF